MKARTQMFGWAAIYGAAGGMSVVAWQDAAATGRTGWAVFFAGYCVCVSPVHVALHWHVLRL